MIELKRCIVTESRWNIIIIIIIQCNGARDDWLHCAVYGDVR